MNTVGNLDVMVPILALIIMVSVLIFDPQIN